MTRKTIIVLLLLALVHFKANCQINSVSELPAGTPAPPVITAPTFDLIELGLTLDAQTAADIQNALINPYAENEIDIWAELRDAQTNQLEKTVYGFFMTEFDVDADGQTTNTSATQQFNWRLRFVVEEAKNYTLTLHFQTATIPPTPFATTYTITGATSANPGYLRFPKGHKYMEFTDGTPFFGVAETLPPFSASNARQWRDPTSPNNILGNTSISPAYSNITVQGFNEILDQFSDFNGNYIKHYFAPEAIDLEWDVLGNYNTFQDRAHDFDNIITHLEATGIYMQLAPWTWEQFSPEYNTNVNLMPVSWLFNPYNTLSSVNDPIDVFIDGCQVNYTAVDFMKRKIRYCIARWGYSPNFAALELMTEIDKVSSIPNVKDYWSGTCSTGRTSDQIIDEALIYLGTYIKELSPRILVTTGVASYYGSAEDFYLSNVCDYVDYHEYCSNQINGGATNAYVSEYCKSKYKKPFHSGECGSGDNVQWYSGGVDANSLDRQTQFSNIMWSSAFSGSFTNAMYFLSYGGIHTTNWFEDANEKFEAINTFFANEDLNSEQYKSIRNKVQGGFTLNCNGNINEQRPECLATNPNLLHHINIYGYDPGIDHINLVSGATVAEITTSDNDHIEVYALSSSRRILGWVHNKTNYFYNLPHLTNPMGPNIPAYMHPLANGQLEAIPDIQRNSYVDDIDDQTMTISGLDCSGTYQIEWFGTRGAGGIISNLTVSNITPVNGAVTFDIPNLRAVNTNNNDLPDYGFKISMTQNNGWTTNGSWEDDYVNFHAPTLPKSMDVAMTPNNDIFFIGADNELYRLYHDEHCWEQERLLLNPTILPYVATYNTPIVALANDDKIFFKNVNNKLEQLYITSSNPNTYTPYTHSSAPDMLDGDIIASDGAIYYVGTGNYITEVYWNGAAWSHYQLNVGGTALNQSDFTVLPGTNRKVFYRNANGKLQQYYWGLVMGNYQWVAYTHTTTPNVTTSSPIKHTPDGRIVYVSTNDYVTVLTFNTGTQTWTAQELTWLPKTLATNCDLVVANDNKIFYRTTSGALQQVYWGLYQGTNQWIGYTHTTTIPANTEIKFHEDGIGQYSLFFWNNILNNVYFDNGTNTWNQYIHSSSSIDPSKGVFRLPNTGWSFDRYGKLYFIDSDPIPRARVLWWDNPCTTYTPCTEASYRPDKPTLVSSVQISEDDLQVEGEVQNSTLNKLKNAIPINVYPNPSKNGLFNISGINENSTIEVRDIHSRVIVTRREVSNKTTIDLSSMPNGVYFLHYISNNKAEVKKLQLNR